jgi:hypothetical protein
MRRLTAYLFIPPAKTAKTPTGALRRLGDLVQSASHGEGSVKSFGILSADRSELSPEEIAIRRNELKAAIRDAGLGFAQQVGLWTETVRGSRGEEVKVPVREMSFFIPNVALSQLRRLASWFDQEAVVYSGPETKGRVQVIGDNWSDDIGDFTTLTNAAPADVAGHENRSEVQGRPYTFAPKASLFQRA